MSNLDFHFFVNEHYGNRPPFPTFPTIAAAAAMQQRKKTVIFIHKLKPSLANGGIYTFLMRVSPGFESQQLFKDHDGYLAFKYDISQVVRLSILNALKKVSPQAFIKE